MAQKGFFVFSDLKPLVDLLNFEERGQLLTGMFQYTETGEMLSMLPNEKLQAVWLATVNKIDLGKKHDLVFSEQQSLRSMKGHYKGREAQEIISVLLKKLADYNGNIDDFKKSNASIYSRLEELQNVNEPQKRENEKNVSPVEEIQPQESDFEPVPPADFEEYYPSEEELQESYEYLKEPIRDGYIYDKASLELYRSEIEQSGCDFDSLSGWLFNGAGASNIGKPFCDVLESYKKHVGRR